MDNVNVAIRVRPLIQREKNAETEPQWKTETNKISQLDHRGRVSRMYAFDRIFSSSETTSDVYDEIALPIVGKAMDGVNGTIFAYGQTASGKTYTMMGDRMCPGIIPRAVQEIFTRIDNTSNREFLLRVSYMELYNEGLSDLLSSEKKTLQIRENDKTVFVHDLTEEVVTNVQEVLQFLKKGEARRHFGQTDMNERSSRSHTIFRMIIESRETSQRNSTDMAVKVSHLNLVDLAGSERANETKADGIRLREACKINQSLHVLAMVINKLSQNAEFIPFRDSKLTRILQMSLGGNAKTAIICTVTPISVEQTHSTLQFASRAKTIKNKPEVNEVVSDEAMMQRQKKEIQELKRKISALEQQGELFEEKSRLHETQEQKIKILEKMILVSGGAGISSIMPSNETTKAKYKRRQTWCPGMANHLPLLRPKPPSELAPNIMEETSSPETKTQSSLYLEEEMQSLDPDASPQESVTSVGSEEFSNTKQFQFWEDMEMEQAAEHGISAFPLSPQRKKRKRREAHVHFANFDLGTMDAESQTQVKESQAQDTDHQISTLKKQLEEQDLVKDSLSKSEQEILALKVKLEETVLLLDFAKEKEQEAMLTKEQLDQQDGLKVALSNSEQEVVSLRSKLEETQFLLGSAEEKEEEVVLMKEQLDQQEGLQAALNNSEQEMVTLRAKLEETQFLLASAEEKEVEIVHMKTQLDQQDAFKDSLQKSELEISSLKAQLEEYDMRSVASSLENDQKVLDLTEQYDQLRSLFQKSEQEILALKEELQEQDAHKAASLEITEEVLQLKSRLEQQSDLKDLLLRKEEELSALKVELEEKTTLLASAQENELQITQLKELEKTVQMRDEEVEMVNKLLEEQTLKLKTLSQALEEQRSEVEKQPQESAAQIDTMSQQIKSMQKNTASVAGVSTVSSGAENKDVKPTTMSQEESEEVHEKIKELTKILSARQEEIETLNHFLVEQGKEAEETRNHHVARIAELTALLEDQQGQLAMAAGPSKGCVERLDEAMSLADEIEAQNWKARTESELLGSVQLCEDIMEEKTKLSRQVLQFQDEMTSLKDALKAKAEELEELQEFTQVEMTVMKEQEAQYQRDAEDLRMKLGVKDKVLEAQYQQDVDELLDKLREKNQKIDNLQEQQSGLVQAVSLAEKKVEQLQGQLGDLESCDTMKENGSMEGQDQPIVQQVVNKQVLSEEYNEGSSLHTPVSVLEEATRVSPEDSGLLVDGSSVQPEILQQRINELEITEASLRQECETLNATISSQDQEIEVLNELLEEFGQETKDNSQNDTKIVAFVERIEQLEQQLQKIGLPTTNQIQEPDVDQEIQVLTEVNDNLSEALTQAGVNFEKLGAEKLDLEEALKQAVGSRKDLDSSQEKNLMNLKKDLESLNEANVCLSEKLTCAQELCEKLEGKLLESNGEKQESEEEIRALTAVIDQQGQEMASQKVKLEEAEDILGSNVGDVEDSVVSLKRENQSLVERCVSEATKHDKIVKDIKSKDVLLAEQLNKLTTLSERLLKIEEELLGRTVRVQELEAALASQSSQSAEAAEIIRMRDGELEMLREVLQVQEQHLDSVRNDYSQAQFRVKDLEREVNFLNETKGDQLVHESQKENEIYRLSGLLENQEEQLRTKEQNLMESLSKIQHLESVLSANNDMNLEKSKGEKQQNAKIHKLQNYLEELENQLRAREITCSELEAKLQDLERVVAANDRKRVDLEDVKLKLESKVKTLQGYLDEVDEELHQFKNRYADLQADFRKQQANIKNMEAVLESRSQSTEMLQTTVAKHDKEVVVLRTQLYERSHTTLMQKAAYSEMLAKVQNLEGVITSKEQTTKEIKDLLKIKDAELQRSQEQQDRRLQEEITRREEEILTLRQQLENAVESLKTSPSVSPEEINKLQEEKNDLQSQLDQTNQKLTNKIARMTKLGKIYDDLRTTCSALEQEYDDEKAQHQETKQKLQKAETDLPQVDDFAVQSSSVDLLKTHRQQVAEKNLRINQLETDLLRGTDPLERKILSLREEVSYQESKVQQYKKEVVKLRSQQSQKAPSDSSTTSGSSSISERIPEATGGSGIIESCAIFAVKAENYKLTKELAKTKKELDYKDLKYHDEVTKKTHAEQDARDWKEKARSLASHLKKALPQRTESLTASPLKERNTNDPTLAKKSRSDDTAGTRYVEKIAGLKSSAAVESSSSSKRPDYNWLSKAVAERDAEESQTSQDDPQQCPTQ